MDVILLGLLNKTAKEVLQEAKKYTNELVSGGAIDISEQIEEAIQEFIDKETPEDGTVNTFKELLQYVATHQREFEEISKTIEELVQKNQEQDNALANKTQVVMKIWGDDE